MTTTVVSRRARVGATAATATSPGPGVLNLGIYQGDYLPIVFHFLDDTGAAADITDIDWAAQIRRVSADADAGGSPAAAFTATIDPPGTLTLELAAADAADLIETSYRWDLQGTPAGTDRVTTYIAGAITVTKEITRP